MTKIQMLDLRIVHMMETIGEHKKQDRRTYLRVVDYDEGYLDGLKAAREILLLDDGTGEER